MKTKQGDVARLKSGGPIMSVGHRCGDCHWCDWFDEQGNHRTYLFHLDQLEIVLPEKR
jgi:uncharacterized protein YodC (DUF2158 family)